MGHVGSPPLKHTNSRVRGPMIVLRRAEGGRRLVLRRCINKFGVHGNVRYGNVDDSTFHSRHGDYNGLFNIC